MDEWVYWASTVRRSHSLSSLQPLHTCTSAHSHQHQAFPFHGDILCRPHIHSKSPGLTHLMNPYLPSAVAQYPALPLKNAREESFTLAFMPPFLRFLLCGTLPRWVLSVVTIFTPTNSVIFAMAADWNLQGHGIAASFLPSALSWPLCFILLSSAPHCPVFLGLPRCFPVACPTVLPGSIVGISKQNSLTSALEKICLSSILFHLKK